ncbi:hypothetical protein E2C01_072020 [Portunus trituberculatus]|uniref:Uncharacterized protein n=1 Tax=Portunus trituberculatus TaxID=210409 RepID=A0A5B7I5F9_PORTR|nr:hypothetical protein [Portunus trituberculatus]
MYRLQSIVVDALVSGIAATATDVRHTLTSIQLNTGLPNIAPPCTLRTTIDLNAGSKNIKCILNNTAMHM